MNKHIAELEHSLDEIHESFREAYTRGIEHVLKNARPTVKALKQEICEDWQPDTAPPPTRQDGQDKITSLLAQMTPDETMETFRRLKYWMDDEPNCQCCNIASIDED